MPRQWDGLYQSYTNSLAVNDVVLVPYYEGISDNLAEALPVYQAAYPGREIIPIESSMLITLNGAVHCTAMTTPR
jgi:agmatine/peptidylarginine deiminase